MTLDAGTRLGPYEIVAPVGAGGSACGHTTRERGVGVSARGSRQPWQSRQGWGWGPSRPDARRAPRRWKYAGPRAHAEGTQWR
jgi:hypothetical protein